MEQTLVRGSHSDSSSDSRRQITEQALVRNAHSGSSSDSLRQVMEQTLVGSSHSDSSSDSRRQITEYCTSKTVWEVYYEHTTGIRGFKPNVNKLRDSFTKLLYTAGTGGIRFS